MKAKVKNDLSRMFSYSLLFVWVLICTVPVIYLFVASFQHSAIFTSPAKILSLKGLTLENYIKALKIGNFTFFLKNSIIVSIGAVIISLAVCLPLAYGLA